MASISWNGQENKHPDHSCWFNLRGAVYKIRGLPSGRRTSRYQNNLCFPDDLSGPKFKISFLPWF